MISWKIRLQMAWKVLWLQEFKMVVAPYHKIANISTEECDNNWRAGERRCPNKATKCLSRTNAEFKLNIDDHWHVCNSCAAEFDGKMTEPG